MTSGKLPKDGYLLGDMELRGIIEAFAEDNAIFQAVGFLSSASLLNQHDILEDNEVAPVTRCINPPSAAQRPSLLTELCNGTREYVLRFSTAGRNFYL